MVAVPWLAAIFLAPLAGGLVGVIPGLLSLVAFKSAQRSPALAQPGAVTAESIAREMELSESAERWNEGLVTVYKGVTLAISFGSVLAGILAVNYGLEAWLGSGFQGRHIWAICAAYALNDLGRGELGYFAANQAAIFTAAQTLGQS